MSGDGEKEGKRMMFLNTSINYQDTLTVPVLGNIQRAAQLLPDPERNHLPEHGQFGGKDLGTGPLPASG